MLAVWLAVDGQEIAVLSVHTTRPRSHWTAWWQREEFRALAAWSQEQQLAGRAVILIGDFNATPWSEPLRELMRDGGLEPTGTTPFARGSWPGVVPMLPIDMAVVGDGEQIWQAESSTQRRPVPSATLGAGSPSVRGIGHERGPYVGGDHRPVVYTFGLFPFR